MLWFGELKIYENKKTIIATKLPERITIEKREKDLDVKVQKPLKYIYEPDPAFIKAKLISEIAEIYKLSKISKNTIYLTGNSQINNPILKRYKVIETADIDYERINNTLEKHSIGKLDFKSKGIDIDITSLHKVIKGSGQNKGLVILTKALEIPTAIICKYE